MNFSETYARVSAPVVSSPRLIEKTLEKTKARRPSFPLRRLAAIAAAAAVLLATPALAAQTEPGYYLLYALSPAYAQFFQPVRRSCTDNGVTVEVSSVRVEGDTAQAYIALRGAAVDANIDLFDSYSFHFPFDQTSHCERAGFDSETNTVFFLATTRTMDGADIPLGRKMTFSLGCFLSGKQALEGAAIPLELSDYAAEAETAEGLYRGGGNLELLDSVSMLRPGAVLAEPAPGLTVTAAGYADGLFHVQLCQGDAGELDNHGFLWLENGEGERLEDLAVVYFADFSKEDVRLDYQEFVFDVSPEELANYTLHGDFWTAAARIDGDWRITFPLENAG
nr:DUF4179 domain-containing protein [uncultured Oscillibacter sp.]